MKFFKKKFKITFLKFLILLYFLFSRVNTKCEKLPKKEKRKQIKFKKAKNVYS